MYKYGIIKQTFACIGGMFGKTRASRRFIRDSIRYKDLICTVRQNNIPRQKYKTKIPFALCFDGNGAYKAAVTLQSLLVSSSNRCDYDIYCIIDSSLDSNSRKTLQSLVKGTNSTIQFIEANHDFDKSNRRKWPVAVWYRLMLPKLLPNVRRIIYADIDIIFFNDLIDIYEYDLKDNIIAAVPTRTDMYINSGFLLMDLDKIRKEKFYEEWVKTSQIEDYKNPDQDVLNHTLKNRIAFLPLRYNFQLSHGSRIFKIYPKNQLDDLKHNLVVLHYSDFMKPWDSDKKRRPVFSKYWWEIAKQTGLFKE